MTTWKPTVKWYNISPDSYKLIISEAKERFEELSSESESITNKSIKILYGTIAIAFYIFQYIFNKKYPTVIVLISIVLCLIALLCILFVLVAPKEVRFKGMSPENSLPPELDHPEDIEHQEQNIYFHLMLSYQNNIEFMIGANNRRIRLYKIALGLIILILIITSITAMSTLSTTLG